jgi:hypothetical protein
MENNQSTVSTNNLKNMNSRNNKMKMMRIISAVASVVIFSVIFFLLGNGKSIDGQIRDAANEINKSTPLQIDSITTLTTATAQTGKKLVYNYELDLSSYEAFDSEQIESLKNSLELQVKEQIRTNPEIKTLRDKDVTFGYSYSDHNGTFLFQFDVTPNDYK